MRKTIIFGSLVAVCLMLIVQINPTVGYYEVEQEKNKVNRILKNRSDMENSISETINEIKNKYPAICDKMSTLVSSHSFDALCDFLYLILAILNGLKWTIVAIPLLLLVYLIYIPLCYSGPPP